MWMKVVEVVEITPQAAAYALAAAVGGSAAILFSQCLYFYIVF